MESVFDVEDTEEGEEEKKRPSSKRKGTGDRDESKRKMSSRPTDW